MKENEARLVEAERAVRVSRALSDLAVSFAVGYMLAYGIDVIFFGAAVVLR